MKDLCQAMKRIKGNHEYRFRSGNFKKDKTTINYTKDNNIKQQKYNIKTGSVLCGQLLWVGCS